MAFRSIGLIIAGLCLPAAVGAASAATLVTVTANHVTRDIDCKGADLAVSGNGDTLTLARCNTITVLGDDNRISAMLLRTSTIAAVGNHNNIRFEDEPGYDPQVTATGTDNEIVPRMSDKDMQPSPPFKRLGTGH